jgi:hypothetical protein
VLLGLSVAAEVAALTPLSFLSDPSLSDALTVALRVAARTSGGYVEPAPGYPLAWQGPAVPRAVFEVVDEWVRRARAVVTSRAPAARRHR